MLVAAVGHRGERERGREGERSLAARPLQHFAWPHRAQDAAAAQSKLLAEAQAKAKAAKAKAQPQDTGAAAGATMASRSLPGEG